MAQCFEGGGNCATCCSACDYVSKEDVRQIFDRRLRKLSDYGGDYGEYGDYGDYGDYGEYNRDQDYAPCRSDDEIDCEDGPAGAVNIDFRDRDKCVCVVTDIDNQIFALTDFNDCAVFNQPLHSDYDSGFYGYIATNQNYLYAGAGDDVIVANHTDKSEIWGQEGDDTFVTISDFEVSYGGEYKTFVGGMGNTFHGGCGDDTLHEFVDPKSELQPGPDGDYYGYPGNTLEDVCD